MAHPLKDPVTWLYPPIEPYKTGRLKVSDVHELYFEESGNPNGKPAIFLHGGPGGGSDPKVRLAAAKIWSGWEGGTSKLLPDADFTGHYEEDEFALAFARIEVHYFANRGFFEVDDQLLRDAAKIRHIPGVIVQGRYDVVCPIFSAWALHRAWPEADLVISPDAGHSAWEPANSRALVAATDKFA